MGYKRYAYRILMGKPAVKKPLGRSINRWVNNIKMYLREIAWNGMDWIDLGQDHSNEPSGSIKFWEIFEYLQNWRLLQKGSAP
jgi:hypothetical protein